MEKPATIIYKEFREKVINAVNESGLPAFVISLGLNQILREVQQLESQQLQSDIDSYKENSDGSND